MAKTTSSVEADVLSNQKSLLSARSQRTLQSLLGPPKDGKEAKTQDELEEEDAEAFKPEPDELLGPGFPTHEDGDPLSGLQNGRSRRADEKLRKQMLGKNSKRSVSGVTSDGRTGKAVKANVNLATRPTPATTNRSAESDEEEGRSSLGKTKRRKNEQSRVLEVKENEDEEGDQAILPEILEAQPTLVVEKVKKKPGSYLDEILSERSKKKRKRKR